MLNLCLNIWLLAEGEVVVEEEGAVGVDPLLGVKVQLEVRIIPITHMEKLEVIMKVTRIWCTKQFWYHGISSGGSGNDRVCASPLPNQEFLSHR